MDEVRPTARRIARESARRVAQEARESVRNLKREAKEEAKSRLRAAAAEIRNLVKEGRRAPQLRRRDAEATKQALLDAARKCFGHGAYDQVGLRDIAARAKVDVALIARYFGSKEDLFAAAIATEKRPPPPTDLPPRSEFGPWLARRILSITDDDPTRLLVLHHAVGNPKAAAVVRKLVMERFIKPVGAYIGGPDGETRASLIYSHLVGLGMMARLVKLDPIAGADLETLIALLGPALQAYVD
jgi:AcrR family transcriptional regulator